MEPLYNRVVIKKIKRQDTTASGLYIPETAAGNVVQGEVVATGPGLVRDNGQLIPTSVKVGDVVAFGKNAGYAMDLNEVSYVILPDTDILCVL